MQRLEAINISFMLPPPLPLPPFNDNMGQSLTEERDKSDRKRSWDAGEISTKYQSFE